MIDLHTHVLPGIDDGPAAIDGSLAIARAAAAGGTRALVATPHVNWRYRNDAETIARLVQELGERLASEQVLTSAGETLAILPGAEIALTMVPELQARQLAALSIAGGPWLLIEPPFTPQALNLDALLLELQSRGHRIVIAHPERCPAFQRDPRMLERLLEAGMLSSVTAGSLTGRFGGEARELALALARDGMLHNVASDAHDELGRPPIIAAELERAGLGPLRQWLTVDVPGAILAGGEIPSRPAISLPALTPERASRWRVLRR
jgi:protein-tyrosine phosphatase